MVRRADRLLQIALGTLAALAGRDAISATSGIHGRTGIPPLPSYAVGSGYCQGSFARSPFGPFPYDHQEPPPRSLSMHPAPAPARPPARSRRRAFRRRGRLRRDCRRLRGRRRRRPRGPLRDPAGAGQVDWRHDPPADWGQPTPAPVPPSAATAREFYSRIRAHYAKKYGEASAQVKDSSGGYRFEPHVALLVLEAMLAEAKVKPLLGQRIVGVTKDGTRLVALKTAAGDAFKAKDVHRCQLRGRPDGSGGVQVRHGPREPRGLQGIARRECRRSAGRTSSTSPSMGARPASRCLSSPASRWAKPGTGDKKVQAYNFRLCLTDDMANQLAFRQAGRL